jgi:hypothetical protein
MPGHPAIRVARRINSFGVIETMADVMLTRGVPEHIRSDNGAEMTAKIVRNWLAKLGVRTLYIEPGSLWENGYCESFNGKLRDECLNQEIFYSLKEAQVVIEQWRNHFNTIGPHSSRLSTSGTADIHSPTRQRSIGASVHAAPRIVVSFSSSRSCSSNSLSSSAREAGSVVIDDRRPNRPTAGASTVAEDTANGAKRSQSVGALTSALQRAPKKFLSRR